MSNSRKLTFKDLRNIVEAELPKMTSSNTDIDYFDHSAFVNEFNILSADHNDNDVVDIEHANTFWNVMLLKLAITAKECGNAILLASEREKYPLSMSLFAEYFFSREQKISEALTSVAGIDCNIRDARFSRTPLMWAIINNNTSIVMSLIAHKDLQVNLQDIDGKTAMMFAAQHGQYDTVKILLENGADPSLADKNGCTAMQQPALTRLNQPLIKALLNQEMSVRYRY